jgi:hypothetical protein
MGDLTIAQWALRLERHKHTQKNKSDPHFVANVLSSSNLILADRIFYTKSLEARKWYLAQQNSHKLNRWI